MYTIISFDPASKRNLGYAIIIYKRNKIKLFLSDTYVFNTENSIERLHLLGKFLIKLLKKYDPNVVIFENSVGQGFAPARANINEIVGVIKYVCKSYYDIDCVSIHPSTWKKVISGKGNTKSNVIKDILEDYFNKSFNTLHEVDAVAIALTYCINNLKLKWEYKKYE